MQEEHGEALEVMRTIKKALDPDNRMNPGKIVDIPAR
jgi:D-lactate dehydrogenase (cytochrome)